MPASREAFRVPCFLTWPPSNAPVEPGEATARVPSVAYGLGVTKRPSGACSASTWPIFRWFYQIVKLAQKVPFGLQLADAGSLCNPRVPETLLQSWDAAPDTSARTSRRPTEAVAAAPLGTWRRSGRRRLKCVGARRRDEIPTHIRVSTHLESCILLFNPRLFLRGREQPTLI